MRKQGQVSALLVLAILIFFYPGNLRLLKQWPMLLLPLLLTLPGEFLFAFFFIYLLFIPSIYSTEQVFDKSGISIAPPECS